MLNWSSKKRLLVGLLISVPVAVFFGARSAASWRPQLIGVQTDVTLIEKGPRMLQLSPQSDMLLSWSYSKYGYQWDLTTGTKRRVDGEYGTFSGDGRCFVTFKRYVSKNVQNIFLYSSTKQQWKRELHRGQLAGLPPCFDFVDSNRRLVVSTGKQIRVLDVLSGKTVTQRAATLAEYISFLRRLALSPSSPDSIKISTPTVNGKRLNLMGGGFVLYGVKEERSGRILWSRPASSAEISVPQFEDGGRSVAIIEGDCLVVRDSLSGKIVFKHKNNLPAPLVSWAFTKNRDAVYLMDEQGEIFRQRLG